MKKVLYIVGALIIVVIVTLFALRLYTKSHSPYEEVSYNDNLTIKYSRPFKSDRKIFGELVPFDKVWRTGANEATIFSTTQDIKFGGQDLKAGEYSLWTIPGKDSWTIILNSETGQWGISMASEANKRAENDVLSVVTPVVLSDKVFEQLTINFEEIHDELELIILWDQTMVIIPIDIQ